MGQIRGCWLYMQQNNEYTYDDNGSLTQDLNKRISSIQYNLLNLPQNITFSTGSTIGYTYDAAGRKLHVAYGSPSSTMDYCGNMTGIRNKKSVSRSTLFKSDYS